MNATNRTLYIPLYGKALVSRKGVLLRDSKAEQIWAQEGFPLHGKPKSKWLAYFMGMRAAVMDQWLRERLDEMPGAAVLHLGCGLDSRVLRVGVGDGPWYDVDMPEVIGLRRRYYEEQGVYHMIGADVTELGWLEGLPDAPAALVVLEGLSMYLPMDRLKALLEAIQRRFGRGAVILDAYTRFAVRASKYANPIKAVGAGVITGIDDPEMLSGPEIRFREQRSLTPETLICELDGFDAWFFRKMFAGKATDGLYRLYTYSLGRELTSET